MKHLQKCRVDHLHLLRQLKKARARLLMKEHDIENACTYLEKLLSSFEMVCAERDELFHGLQSCIKVIRERREKVKRIVVERIAHSMKEIEDKTNIPEHREHGLGGGDGDGDGDGGFDFDSDGHSGQDRGQLNDGDGGGDGGI